MTKKQSLRADDEVLSMNSQEFWKLWIQRERELEDNEPKCTCDLKDYKRGYHFMKCPYLKYWEDAFIKYAEDFRNKTVGRMGLDKWMK